MPSLLKLYSNPRSSSARRVLLTASQLGLELDIVTLTNLMDPAQRADLLKVNPNGRIPVLADGDFLLWESGAIMHYLCEQSPGQTLYPSELKARCDVNRWLFWGGQHWSPAIGVLGFEYWVKAFLNMGEPDPREVARGEREFTRAAAVLDAHLQHREWVSGDSVTLADFALAPALNNWPQIHLPLAGHHNILAWLDRVQALPAWKNTQPAA